MPTSILSNMPDGMGFYYGFSPDDSRQINLRWQRAPDDQITDDWRAGTRGWAIYIGGELIGYRDNFFRAEAAALKWMREHPET